MIIFMEGMSMPIWRKTGNGNLRTYNTYLNDMFTSIEERKSFFIRLYIRNSLGLPSHQSWKDALASLDGD